MNLISRAVYVTSSCGLSPPTSPSSSTSKYSHFKTMSNWGDDAANWSGQRVRREGHRTWCSRADVGGGGVGRSVMARATCSASTTPWTTRSIAGCRASRTRLTTSRASPVTRCVRARALSRCGRAEAQVLQAGDVVHGVEDVGHDIADGFRDVENFGRGVDNSYDEGVQQGEQQGGW